MKYCKKCGVQIVDDKLENCSLCGASLTNQQQTSDDFVCANYNAESKRPKNKKVKDIFIGISTLLFIVACVVSLLTKRADIVVYSILGLAFVWYAILWHIFDQHDTREILDKSIGATVVYIIGFLIYYGYGVYALEYVLPLAIIVLICTEFMISFIGKQFRTYALSLLIYSILGIVWFLVNYFCNLDWYVACVSMALSVVSIIGMFVFGRKTLFIQLNKIFRL